MVHLIQTFAHFVLKHNYIIDYCLSSVCVCVGVMKSVCVGVMKSMS